MSGDIQTRIPGTGGVGIDIYTVLAPGAGPTPPPAGAFYQQEANTDVYLQEVSGKYIQE